jgi:thioredoxin-dependent peroxiredoxin
MTIEVGKKAPAFRLTTDGNGKISLGDLKGKPIILYFYPKDDTSGCTKEACAFRDLQREFKKIGANVIGVSRDSVASHDKFKKKYELNFLLGSDAEGTVSDAFGTWVQKSMYGRKYMGMERATFLIDGKGVVREIWRKVKVPGHAEAVLEAARRIAE